MIRLLRKYNKKILAVLGVFLMIAFVADLGYRRSWGGRGQIDVRARIGNEKVRSADYQYALIAWELLRGHDLAVVYQRGTRPDGQPYYVADPLAEHGLARRLLPLYFAHAPYEPFAWQQARVAAEQLVRRMDAMTFLLLLKEAQRSNVRASKDAVAQLQAGVMARREIDPALRQRVITDWLSILELFDRLAGACKISRSAAVHETARRQQQVSLKLVEFPASRFRDQVASPTTQQVQAFYEQYRDVTPEQSESGFGYRYPHRIKLEYIRIPYARMKERVSDQDTYKFWKDNQHLFPATQPSESPATAPADSAATQPATRAASTQPTTRPWEEVRDRIRDQLAGEWVSLMEKNLLQILRADFAAYRGAAEAGATTGPVSVPASSLGVPYNSYVYLQRLQARIQSLRESHNVLPELASEGEWLSKADLEKLPGIGQAYLVTADFRRVRFADLAIDQAAAFLTEAQIRAAQSTGMGALLNYQPSPALRDAEGNRYIFRITEADPSHIPASLEEVAAKVREDWRTAQAYEKARAEARRFVETARSQGLESAARAAGDLPVITTGLFNEDARGSFGSYDVVPRARPAFARQAFDLLRWRLATGQEHPVGVIDLLPAATSLVAELADARPAVRHDYFDLQVARTRQEISAVRMAEAVFSWFSPEDVERRMNYTAERPELHREAPPQPPPPLF